MPRSSRWFPTAVVLALLAVSTVSAQSTNDRRGFWFGFGLGWDAGVTRNMSITPALNLSFGQLDDTSVALLQLAVGLTWH